MPFWRVVSIAFRLGKAYWKTSRNGIREAKCCRHGGGCDVPSVAETACKDLNKLNHTAPTHDATKPVLEQNSSRGVGATLEVTYFVFHENVDSFSDQLSSIDDSTLKVCLNEFASLGCISQPMMSDVSEVGS